MAFIEFETEDAYNEAISKAIEEKNQSWITERLDRAKKQASDETRAEFADYEDLKTQVAGIQGIKDSYEKQLEELKNGAQSETDKIADLTSKNKDLELKLLKMEASIKYGLPEELAGRLNGTDRESIFKDAESLAQFTTKQKPNAPLRDPEADETDGIVEAFKKLNPNLKI